MDNEQKQTKPVPSTRTTFDRFRATFGFCDGKETSYPRCAKETLYPKLSM
jgi:hypothetical protein